jgi:hypothetical protein
MGQFRRAQVGLGSPGLGRELGERAIFAQVGEREQGLPPPGCGFSYRDPIDCRRRRVIPAVQLPRVTVTDS